MHRCTLQQHNTAYANHKQDLPVWVQPVLKHLQHQYHTDSAG